MQLSLCFSLEISYQTAVVSLELGLGSRRSIYDFAISIYAKSVEHSGVNGLRMFNFDSDDAVITLRLSVSPCSLQRTTRRQSSNPFCLGQITFNTNFNRHLHFFNPFIHEVAHCRGL